ncbi:hypothetical protein EG859_15255, partial [Enterococcus faecalis]
LEEVEERAVRVHLDVGQDLPGRQDGRALHRVATTADGRVCAVAGARRGKNGAGASRPPFNA